MNKTTKMYTAISRKKYKKIHVKSLKAEGLLVLASKNIQGGILFPKIIEYY